MRHNMDNETAETLTLVTQSPDINPRVDAIYRINRELGIIYGIPAAAPVRPRLPEGAEGIVYLFVQGTYEQPQDAL